jgi:hypothetical protein
MDRANEGNGCSEPVDVVKAGGLRPVFGKSLDQK